jgi:TRAP-type C4-dicarboxylate transport system permease small subunit
MKIEKIINTWIPVLSGVMLILMVGITFLQIVLREFFNFGVGWTEEIPQCCQTWMVLLGSIWVTKNNRHLNTGLKLHQNLNQKQTSFIDSILALAIVIVAVVVAYQSAIFAFSKMGMGFLTLSWLKMGYVYIVLPIFMLTVIYYYLRSFFKNMAFIFSKGE